MIQPGSGAALRTRRFILWTLLVAEIAVGVLVAVLVQHGRKPVIPLPLEHAVAYAWVAVTIAAAVGAYLLALHGAGPHAPFRVGLAAGLSHLAALAGMGAFYVLEIWPMVAIGGLAALAGLALAYPASTPAAAAASTEPAVSEEATSLPR